MGDLHVEDRGKECVIREVEALKAMGALITKEADSMSPVKFRTNEADKAMWMDTHFYKNKGIAEGNTKGTERWCNRVFCTQVKAGAGIRKWLIFCMDERAGTWIS